MKHISLKSFVLSAAGGELEFIDPDGVPVFAVTLPVGVSLVGDSVGHVPPGYSLRAGKGVEVLPPRSWAGRQPYGEGATETAANPDFRPTSASRLEMEMRLTLRKMQVATRTAEARALALAKVERIPDAPALAPAAAAASDDEAVIEQP